MRCTEASQRKECRALVVKRGTVRKGDEPGVPQGVPVKSRGRPRMSQNTSERSGPKEVSGWAVVARKSASAIVSYYGQLLEVTV